MRMCLLKMQWPNIRKMSESRSENASFGRLNGTKNTGSKRRLKTGFQEKMPSQRANYEKTKGKRNVSKKR